VAREGFEPPKA